jgi:dTDP-4-dehydrorhamnose 3,5-epimerase
MKFTPAALPGVWLIEPEIIGDERGFFCRTFCREEFAGRGIDFTVVQSNLSFNHRRGTLRGMHYQAAPHGEDKLVSCPRGAIFDVALDLRPGSPTFGRWCSAELNGDNHCALFIPSGLAHGFQTLADETLVQYQMSSRYRPEAARGARFDDPAFAIDWPLPVSAVSQRDRSFPLQRGGA